MLREHLAAAALEVRQSTGMTELPVPVIDIGRMVADSFEERPFSEAVGGMTVCVRGRTLIAVNSSITSRGRKRFTVGHEIGHVRLHEGRFECMARDVGTTRSEDPKERQANQFAAELLMPAPEFRKVVGGDAPGWEAILAAAEETSFDVSITAAALRAVKLSDCQCMLAVTRRRRIDWCATSEIFDVWRRRSGPISPDSATAEATTAPPGTIDDGYGDACAWLDDRRIAEVELYLEEEALSLGNGRVLTLLVPEVDVDLDALDSTSELDE